MIKEIEIKCEPAEAVDEQVVLQLAAAKCSVSLEQITGIVTLRRSIDARSKFPKFVLRLKIFIGEKPPEQPLIVDQLKQAVHGKRVLIIGAGPAGYFAALELLKSGLKPIIFDRGKDVQARRRDLRAIQQHSVVNPDSNYCFGEGGAGTYSDGKLYTGSKKRGSVREVLRTFVEHGASEEILFDAHPHIGSNKLPKIIQSMHKTIEHFGGEIHFESHVDDLIIKRNRIVGVIVNSTEEHTGDAVILATGHSARDIFELLHRRKILIEAKPFAMGIRLEHPQTIIDEMQYHQRPRDPRLPAASYKMVTRVENRGVFSFCMCPGGLIVPTATAPAELVVNGMSMAKRDSKFANAGMVVAIEPEDLQEMQRFGALRCLRYQQALEKNIFAQGNGSQAAPAQRLPDFVENKLSADLAPTSYIPGIYSAPLHEILPERISSRLRTALKFFGEKYRGFFSQEANLVGLESRTSSPIRIPRDRDSGMHVEIDRLYPCGEGVGYAGGIVSAALDGQMIARKIAGIFV